MLAVSTNLSPHTGLVILLEPGRVGQRQLREHSLALHEVPRSSGDMQGHCRYKLWQSINPAATWCSSTKISLSPLDPSPYWHRLACPDQTCKQSPICIVLSYSTRMRNYSRMLVLVYLQQNWLCFMQLIWGMHILCVFCHVLRKNACTRESLGLIKQSLVFCLPAGSYALEPLASCSPPFLWQLEVVKTGAEQASTHETGQNKHQLYDRKCSNSSEGPLSPPLTARP